MSADQSAAQYTHEELLEKYEQLQSKHEQLEHLVERFRQEILLLRDKRFGKSRDEVPAGQQELDLIFDEAEVTGTPAAVCADGEEDVVIRSHTRKKRGRKKLPPELPRVVTRIDLAEEQKQCACGCTLVEIGVETSERLIIIPEQRYVEQLQRPKYACHSCEGSGDEDRPAVRIADVPPSIIPKGIASPSVLATVMVNKFVDHLPYYRQEYRFARLGIPVSRQDMSNWQVKCTKALEPVLALLENALKQGPVLQMDETPLQVLNEPGREASQKSYMWLARGGPPETPVVLYRYFPTRSALPAQEMLKEFSGYLQTDAYGAYDTAVKGRTDIVHVGCWAHARRLFTDAAKITKQVGAAHQGVAWIKKLYTAEQQLRAHLEAGTITHEAFTQERKDRVIPILTSFRQWLEKKQRTMVPSLLVGKAVSYTLSQWDKLVRYLDSPYLTPDNNAAERGMKLFATGRKNWIFSGTPAGAVSSCALFSLVETAKSCGINPYGYLYHLFETAPTITDDAQWEQLLPWNVNDRPTWTIIPDDHVRQLNTCQQS